MSHHIPMLSNSGRLLFDRGVTIAASVALASCSGPQSALDPAGPVADSLALVAWVMFIGGAVIFALIVILAALAIFLPPERRGWLANPRTIAIGGIALPVSVLTVLLSWGLSLTGGFAHGSHQEPTLTVEIAGHQWWWEVAYLDQSGTTVATAANEIRMPIGRLVEFVLTSPDVIHSFWVPSLGGKLDMIPGTVNRLRLEAGRAGVYRGQCAEYCGEQHARMAFMAIVQPEAEFVAWLALEASPALTPKDPILQQGADLFQSVGCGTCHTIRGTEAEGTLGPDLTHVGSRQTIGAGMLPNNEGTLAGWISEAQHLKPGIRMPSFDTLTGEELRAIAAYLASLG